MEFKRKTEIFVETSRRFVIHRPEAAEHLFCPQCGEPMLTAEQAAALFDIGRRAVYQIIENAHAHFVETEAGILLVCPDSLTKILQDRKEISGENL